MSSDQSGLAARARSLIGSVMTAGLITAAFCCTASAYTEKTLYTFCQDRNCKDGSGPEGLSIDASGTIYGVTQFGGKYGYGTVYEFSPAFGTHTVLHSFCRPPDCRDGAQPRSGNLVVDTTGNLYGTAEVGGNRRQKGVVFELSPGSSGWHETVLYKFCHDKLCTDGGDIVDRLTYAGEATGQLYDGESPLYGTAEGGLQGGGIVYSITPNAGQTPTFAVLYSFCALTNCPDGKGPSSLSLDSAGNIYGVTAFGGPNQGGTVFQLAPAGSTYTESVLHSFCAKSSCTDGQGPDALVLDARGNFVGSTAFGGKYEGTLFKMALNNSQWQYKVLARFTRPYGFQPGVAIIDGSGNVFGAASSGGATYGGTIFEFNSGGLQTLYSFCPAKGCADGNQPAGLVEDANGNLYGVAYKGGHKNKGTLFELSP